ncbi:hypothetical protein CDL12_19050 [Handroanthus impetiginosus]|uniref:Cyclin-like domain-containing protein n=1 Tax=Handroanthus impetiginosus TaxID=429701 RepID=A0A2G9GSY9_9LAMI|nr:hypothetical protein CDL12_19050 [Handroanthus impetiginosus]
MTAASRNMGRLKPLRDRATQDQKMSNSVGQEKNLKIYVEVDKTAHRAGLNNGTNRKSIPPNSGSYLLNVNDSKSWNLGKSKCKPNKCVNPNGGRKVLADIGNVNRSFSKTEQGKSSRPLKSKPEIVLNSQRKGKSKMIYRESHGDAVDLGNMEASSSDKPSRESVTLDLTEATDGIQTSKKPSVNENTESASDEPRTKFQGRSSTIATATGRKTIRYPLYMTRKSLPVLKQVSCVKTSGTAKENSEKLDKFSGKHGFPVKPSMRRSIAPKPSNLSSRPWGNRVSDGFVMMASRAQTKVDPGVLSGKSVKPTVRSTITSLSTQRNSKLNHTFTMKKLKSRPVDLSKRKQEKASVSKYIPSVVSHEEPSPGGDTGCTIPRRKSDRRNSFTCSLMSRSKLLKVCGKAASPETLPNIYDDRNHLEVCDYVDDIYQYYWVTEAQNPLLKKYMEIQSEITPQMRGILINWLIEVHLKFALMEETLFLTVTLLDRYLSLESIKKNEMQLVGLTALLLASKYEDFWHPRVTDLISISAESYTRDQMLTMEKTILKKLKFRLNEPTSYVFMLRFLKAAQSDKKVSRKSYQTILIFN